MRASFCSVLFSISIIAAAGCGPSTRDGQFDPTAPCSPGDVEVCYSGQLGTEGVGPCHAGTSTCNAQGVWSACEGEVVPVAENCSDGIDNNCSGEADEDVDLDGDGVTTCGGDCCDSTECADPGLVNPGAFDAVGNLIDDDCNGVVDDAVPLCDSGIASNTSNAMDFAKAIELCQTTTLADKTWGVISAKLSLADGAGTPAPRAHAVRPKFGTNVLPKGGASVALLSTGAAAAKGDTNPAYQDFQDTSEPGNDKESAYPADFVAANGGDLPNAPGCAAPSGDSAQDPVMLTLEIRVPTNAKSFTLDTNFFSSEFPEYTCSPFNDFFVVLLDSTYAGQPANPTDKNLAFYTPAGSTMKYPVGVNLAAGDTGLFTQCINGKTGCAMLGSGTINTCTGTDELVGTGLDTADSGSCDTNSKQGGGTGWLQTSGNVVGGEIIKVRIAIWDTSDHILDSIAVIDHFQWSVDAAQPGTVIFGAGF
jgi:hypothetical protein